MPTNVTPPQLVKYVQHLADCNIHWNTIPWTEKRPNVCTCGLDAVLNTHNDVPTPSVEKSEGEEAIKMPKEFTDWYNDSQDAFMEAKFNMAEIAYAAWQRGRAGK